MERPFTASRVRHFHDWPVVDGKDDDDDWNGGPVSPLTGRDTARRSPSTPASRSSARLRNALSSVNWTLHVATPADSPAVHSPGLHGNALRRSPSAAGAPGRSSGQAWSPSVTATASGVTTPSRHSPSAAAGTAPTPIAKLRFASHPHKSPLIPPPVLATERGTPTASTPLKTPGGRFNGNGAAGASSSPSARSPHSQHSPVARANPTTNNNHGGSGDAALPPTRATVGDFLAGSDSNFVSPIRRTERPSSSPGHRAAKSTLSGHTDVTSGSTGSGTARLVPPAKAVAIDHASADVSFISDKVLAGKPTLQQRLHSTLRSHDGATTAHSGDAPSFGATSVPSTKIPQQFHVVETRHEPPPFAEEVSAPLPL